jgi:hypothetical protein
MTINTASVPNTGPIKVEVSVLSFGYPFYPLGRVKICLGPCLNNQAFCFANAVATSTPYAGLPRIFVSMRASIVKVRALSPLRNQRCIAANRSSVHGQTALGHKAMQIMGAAGFRASAA